MVVKLALLCPIYALKESGMELAILFWLSLELVKKCENLSTPHPKTEDRKDRK